VVDRLIIDDLKTFTKLGSDDVTYARSCEEGLSAIRSQVWDEIWLDFDLGDSDARPIINLLEMLAKEDKPAAHRIVPVSMNPHGRELMLLALFPFYDVVQITLQEYL
jgi:hypothetical protein